MNTFETSATVEEQGRVLVAGVPFAPGTQVEVTIRELADAKKQSATLDEGRARMRDLFAQVRARNTEPVGPLRRDELYDRNVLR
jgi:hypothetical protein